MAKDKAPEPVTESYLSLGRRIPGGYEVLEVSVAGGKLTTRRVAGPYPLDAAAERLRLESVKKARAAK